MRKTWLAVVLSACATPALATAIVPPEAVDQYKAYCAAEWTKRGVLDQEMFDSCVRDEREGHDRMVRVVAKYDDKPWAQPLLDYVVHEWTKKGIRQDEMVAYDMEREADAYEDLVYETKQPSYDNAKMITCYADSGIQFTMLRYCYKQDEEAHARATLQQQLEFGVVFPEPNS
jgi:hypothetical protein